MSKETRNAPTIGIITCSDASSGAALNGALFYQDLVNAYTRDWGLKADQQHPPVVIINAPCYQQIQRVVQYSELAHKMGAQLIVNTSGEIHSGNKRAVEKQISVQVISFSDNYSVIEQIYLRDHDLDREREDQLYAKAPELAFNHPPTPEALKKNILGLNTLIQETVKNQPAPVFGIVGGGGPAASAEFSVRLAAHNINYVAVGPTGAPGKDAASFGGQDYTPYYTQSVKWLAALGVFKTVFPCNTAHNHLEQYELAANPYKQLGNPTASAILDIRDAVINTGLTKQVIVLATQATYKHHLYEYPLMIGGYKAIIPKQAQQQKLLKAIFDVKAGNIELAKRDILEITSQLKAMCTSADCKVILGCTELNIPFSDQEILAHNFVSSTHALAEAVSNCATTYKVVNGVAACIEPQKYSMPSSVHLHENLSKNVQDLRGLTSLLEQCVNANLSNVPTSYDSCYKEIMRCLHHSHNHPSITTSSVPYDASSDQQQMAETFCTVNGKLFGYETPDPTLA
jgi:aspartate racemase